ncbi:MAG: T9SS type A sorting domain-containing protein [Bacteroidetes bacterium]|nr:T9SS type A sorting domain-containing protein [Bacteroidota bacterium]
MKKVFYLFSLAFIVALAACNHSAKVEKENEEEEYDNPKAREQQEFNKTFDPALGIVPMDRLPNAIEYVHNQQSMYTYDGITTPWTERGPVYDSVAASGNSRGQSSGAGPGTYTSGRVKAFWVDLSDASGNTVFVGGVAGGIWKCTNFMSTGIPNWIPVADYISNLTILSICQNPVNKDIFYAATGEPPYITNAPRGNGLYKSIDHGLTWSPVVNAANNPNTNTIRNGYKVLCDAAGNLYHATYNSGLRRSLDGGKTWAVITPSGVGTNCCDIKLSRNGKLHASFGDNGGGSSSTLYYRYTANPATVAPGSWSSATIPFGTTPSKLELAVAGDTVYGCTFSRTTQNIDFTFRSVNGGSTWVKMNATAYSEFTNTQAWFTQSIGVNPTNPSTIILGQLDCLISNDGGATLSQVSNWVGAGQYVHADIHSFNWWVDGSSQTKLVAACDGGVFLSEDDGSSWRDRNRNLGLKQFYSCAIHPTTTNYFLAGAQDNGVHRLRSAGTSYSHEVCGGDGGFVAIDQDQPTYQFGTYIYQVFRRSTNGGNSWTTPINNQSAGDFINPWTYDDAQNMILAASGGGNFMRWPNAPTAAVTSTVTLSELGGMMGCATVSPYTTGRAFFGSSNTGAIVKVDNTKTTTGTGSADVTDITPSGAPGANTSCIAVGTSDLNLMAVYSNYGIANVWVTSDGGTNWTSCDGNLPDLPVRWAVFHPTSNAAALIGTDLGVYYTQNLNGASTIWTLSPGLPLAAVYMLKLRKSDNLLCAATFGRGLWTANILDVLPLKKITISGTLSGEKTAKLNWNMIDATANAKFFLEYSADGVNFKTIAKTTRETQSYQHQLTDEKGYYRVMGYEPGSSPIYSNVVAIKSAKSVKGLQVNVAPNPVNNNGKVFITSTVAGEYSWQICNVQGSVLHIGKGSLTIGTTEDLKFNLNKLASGMYIVRVTQNGQTKTTSLIKQ